MTAKLQLPNVTLTVVETIIKDLAKIAIDDCMSKADFGDVVIFSDDFNILRVPGAKHILVDNWSDKLQVCSFCYSRTGSEIKTSHQLFVEWDSGIIDPSIWKDEFLEYDFIGAPWWYSDGLNVGNGGFSLRSKRLLDFLQANQETYQFNNKFSDDLLCRKYRPELEKHGFKWAPDSLAHEFAFEYQVPSGKPKSFGFHAMRNWPYALSEDDLTRRFRIAMRSPYIKNTTMVVDTVANAPRLLREYSAAA